MPVIGCQGATSALHALLLLYILLTTERSPGRAGASGGAVQQPVSGPSRGGTFKRRHPRCGPGTGRYTLPAPLRAPGVFGTVGRVPIPRERPLGSTEYSLFALSGALGCALTHSLVVPLDVVKTRIQTRPGQYAGFGDALTTINREEGAAMLLQGLGATVVGYFLYGVSVYPGYEVGCMCM